MAPPGGRSASLLYVSLSSYLLGSIHSLSVVSFFLLFFFKSIAFGSLLISPAALDGIVVVAFAPLDS